MKTKCCHTCRQEFNVMYRVQLKKGKVWVFVCEGCCLLAQKLAEYRYGGTWKGERQSRT